MKHISNEDLIKDTKFNQFFKNRHIKGDYEIGQNKIQPE